MNRKNTPTLFVVTLVVIFAGGFCGNARGMQKKKSIQIFSDEKYEETLQKNQKNLTKTMMRQFCPEVQGLTASPAIQSIKLKGTTHRERIIELHSLCEKEQASLNKTIELKQADNLRAPHYLNFNSYRECLHKLTSLYTPEAFRVTQENDIVQLKTKLTQNDRLIKFFSHLEKEKHMSLPDNFATVQLLTEQGWKTFHKKTKDAKKKSGFPTDTVVKVGGGGLMGVFSVGLPLLFYLLKKK